MRSISSSAAKRSHTITRYMRSPRSRLIALSLTAALFSSTALGAPLDEMSSAEFEKAGLDKLSPEELRYLKEYLAAQPDVAITQTTAPAPAAQDARPSPSQPPRKKTTDDDFGKEQLEQTVDASVPEQIRSTLKGEFRGWDGNTTFRLDNGQIWQQRVGGRYRSPKRVQPEVVIERGRFGYYLKLVETGRAVGVKRIR